MPLRLSNADLIQRFRDIGEKSIQNLILTYFQTELDDRSLNLASIVCGQLTNSRKVFLNQLAVRKCLHDNWLGIQDSYPCLHDFGYVVGDADCMYVIRFPHVNMATKRVHGVETVQDFVDFVLDFVQSLCVPCLDHTNNNCFEMRQKMRDALKECEASTCTQTRTNLLQFFIDNAKPDPGSAVKLVGGDAPTTPAQSIPFWNTGQGMNPPAEGKRVARYEDDPSETRKSMVNLLYPEEERMRLELSEKYKSKDIAFQTEDLLPPIQDIVKHVAQLENVIYSGQEMLRETIWGFMSPLVNTQDTMHQVTFVDGKITLVSVSHNRKAVQIDEDDRRVWDEGMNGIADEIEKCSCLVPLAKLAKLTLRYKYRFAMLVKRGPVGEGRFRLKSFVFVVDDNIYLSELHELAESLEAKEGRTPIIVSDQGIFPKLDHVNEVEFGNDAARDEANWNRVMGTRFEGADIENPGSTAAIAEIFRRVIYGDGPSFLHDDYVVAAVLLSLYTVEDNPSAKDDIVASMAEHFYLRDQLAVVKASDALELSLKRAHELAMLTTEPRVASEETQRAIRQAPPELKEAILTNLRQYIASFVQTGVDDVAKKQVPGWDKFIEYRDSNDPAKRKLAMEAFTLAQERRQQSGRWTGLKYRVLQEYHRTLIPEHDNPNWPHKEYRMDFKSPKEAHLFEQNTKKIFFGRLIEDLNGVHYADLMEESLAVAHALESKIPRTLDDIFKPSEEAYFRDTALYAFIYACCILLGIGVKHKWPLKEEGKTDDDGQFIPGEIIKSNEKKQSAVRWVSQGVAFAITANGEKYELLMAHIATWVLMTIIENGEDLAEFIGGVPGGIKSWGSRMLKRGESQPANAPAGRGRGRGRGRGGGRGGGRGPGRRELWSILPARALRGSNAGKQ